MPEQLSLLLPPRPPHARGGDGAGATQVRTLVAPLVKSDLAAVVRPEPAGSQRRRFEEQMSALAGEPVRLIVNDNRITMLSGLRRKGVLVIRIHHMFLNASEEVLRAAVKVARHGDAHSKRVVDIYIEQHGHLITRPPRQGAQFTAQGKFHDLQVVFDDLNTLYFDNRVQAEIGFGLAGNPKRGRRRTIKLGSYDDSARRITVHPALDQNRVPRVFVDYIVHHEMLHQVLPPEHNDRGTNFHGPRFHAAERLFEGRAEALRWYRWHLELLLRYRG